MCLILLAEPRHESKSTRVLHLNASRMLRPRHVSEGYDTIGHDTRV